MTCLAAWCHYQTLYVKCLACSERSVNVISVCLCDKNIVIQRIFSGDLLRTCYCSGVLGIKTVSAQGA